MASNFPKPLIRRMAREGDAVLGELDESGRRLTPEVLLANTPAYWRRVDNAVRGHLMMMRGMGGGDEERLTATQSLWDNSMGEACALALDEHPGHSVLHVNGGFHSAYWDGTVHQLRLRKPDARILTVDTDAQAWMRAKVGEADKGGDAARAALALIRLKRRLAAS